MFKKLVTITVLSSFLINPVFASTSIETAQEIATIQQPMIEKCFDHWVAMSNVESGDDSKPITISIIPRDKADEYFGRLCYITTIEDAINTWRDQHPEWKPINRH